MTDDLHQLAAAYALDALDTDERVTFEGHLADCEDCQSDVASFRGTVGELAVDRLSPPAELRDQVLTSIADTPQVDPIPSNVIDLKGAPKRPSNAVLGAIAVAAAVIIAVVGFQFRADDPSTTDILEAILASPDVVVNDLGGDVPGSVSVAWSASRGELAVIASDLDDPGDGSVYELWLLDDTGPVPSVLFASAGGADTVIGELGRAPSGWGVTIEPDGGSDAPTSDVIFVVTF